MTSFLEPTLDTLRFEDLPVNWSSLDSKTYSRNKMLYSFQQQAITNIIKTLYLFFSENNGNLSEFYQGYEDIGLTSELTDQLDFQFSKLRSELVNLLLNYYPSSGDSIKFSNFVNRTAFWMATGSGKTLVIVKLLEILNRLVEFGEIPRRDFLVLTHREDLINQIKSHIDEFNELSSQRGFTIEFIELRNYDRIKRENQITFNQQMHVFYYRSDLISDELKEKIIDFKNYENNGNWYLILDEAHKGDKDESKRQILYSILSRNGFLFNFSATFVDPRDLITTVFNFNLQRYINEGYGKHLLLLQEEVNVFREDEGDFNYREKQKIVLQMVILQTYLKKVYWKIKGRRKGIYWEPMMLALVNTVNISTLREKPDLKLFFNEIEKIASGKIEKKLFEEAKSDLLTLKKSHVLYENMLINIEEAQLQMITVEEILSHIFNANTFSGIEVLIIPNKPQEAVLKLKSSTKAFGLIKIGDAINWIKNNLNNYEIIEHYDQKSFFERIDEYTDINLLMGSRAFYEGWDSNRPNIILFINIGKGNKAKKFITQAIGRGVRVEPLKNKKRRLEILHNMKEDENLFNSIGTMVTPLETLFICGTSRENLKEVLMTLKYEKKQDDELVSLKPSLRTYSYQKIQEDQEKFIISKRQFEEFKQYFTSLDIRILMITYKLSLKTINSIINVLYENNISKYFDFRSFDDQIPLKYLTWRIIDFFERNKLIPD